MEAYTSVGHLDPRIGAYHLRHRRYPHVAYTEHHIALTLENALIPIKIPHHSSDDAHRLRSTLQTVVNEDAGVEALRRERPALKRKAVDYLKASSSKWSGSFPRGAGSEVLRWGKDVDPYPLLARPVITELSFKNVIAASDESHQSPLPVHLSELIDPANSHYCVAGVGQIKQIGPKLDVNVVLKLKPRLTAVQAGSIMAITRRIMEGMKKAELRSGRTVADAAIWTEWDTQYEEVMRNMPRPIAPPLSPLLRKVHTFSLPHLPDCDKREDIQVGRTDLVRSLYCHHEETGQPFSSKEMDWTAHRMFAFSATDHLGSAHDRAYIERGIDNERILGHSPAEAVLLDKEIRRDRLVLLEPLTHRRNPPHQHQYHPSPSTYLLDPRLTGAAVHDDEHVDAYSESPHDRSKIMQTGRRALWREADRDDGITTSHLHPTSDSHHPSGWASTLTAHPVQYTPDIGPDKHAEFGDCLPDSIWPQQPIWHLSPSDDTENSTRTSHDVSVVDDIVDQDLRSHGRTKEMIRAEQKEGRGSESRRPNLSKRLATLDLNTLVAKRAKLGEKPGEERINSPHTDAFDTSAHLTEFVSVRTGQTPAPSIEPKRGVCLSEPEQERSAIVKPHWRLNPLLQNAKWYNRVISRPANDQPKPVKHALATINLMHNIPLITALKRENFDLLDEDRDTLSGADVALSPTTGILFRPLAWIVNHEGDIIRDITTATAHYVRVIVIFEVKSYSTKHNDTGGTAALHPQPLDDADPLTPGILRALAIFVDTIAQMGQQRKSISGMPKSGDVKLAFGLNGASEVARVVRAMRDHQPHGQMLNPDCAWLGESTPDQEHLMEDQDHINLFAARAILSLFSPFQTYMSRWTDEEIEGSLSPVMGSELVARLLHNRKSGLQ